MAYSPILDSEIDAESPITESLMFRLRDNPLSFVQQSFTVLTGSGTYNVPADTTLLRVVAVSGGGGGSGSDYTGAYALYACGAGGGGGNVVEEFLTVTAGASLSFACGAGGSGGPAAGNGFNGGDTTFDTITSSGSGTAGLAGTGSSTNSVIIGSRGGGSYAQTCGGIGGGGGFNTNGGKSGTKTGESGGANVPFRGVPGASVGTLISGGGGGPMALPFYIPEAAPYMGAGGAGPSSGNGGNATLNGAGGGGGAGGAPYAGGAGTAGIIFVAVIG